MNWYMEPQRGEGLKFHLLVLSTALSILLLGGGCWLPDWLIKQQRARQGSLPAEKRVHA